MYLRISATTLIGEEPEGPRSSASKNSRAHDIIVNPCRAKKLDNIRTHAHDEKLILAPPRQFSLEAALEFIGADELIEVTPKSIRPRKATLDHNARKRLEKVG